MTTERSWLTVLAVSLAVGVLTFVCTQPQVANDFWLQAKVGEIIAQTGTIPQTLLFPFTEAAGFKFNAHEWLPSLLFFQLIRTTGEASLPLVLGSAGLLLWILTSWFSMQRGSGNVALGMLCGFLALLAENYRHYLRPELLSLFLFMLYWSALETIRTRRSTVAWIAAAALTIVWSNTHGSFVLAPAMAGIYAAGIAADRHRQSMQANSAAPATDFMWLCILIVCCTLINPIGWELWKFVFEFSRGSIAKTEIMEWMPTWDPRLHNVAGMWLGLVVIAFLTTICAVHWRKLSTVDLLLVAFFIALGIKAMRFLVYAGFAAAFIAPAILGQRWLGKSLQEKIYIGLSVLAVCVLLLASQFGNMNGNFPHRSDSTEVFSSPMVNALSDSSMHGNVYTSYDLGAELVFRAYPRLRPSIDSRIDSYGDDYFRFHEELLRDAGSMLQFVRSYDLRYMLLTHPDFELFRVSQPRIAEGWQILLADKRAILLQRLD